MKNFKRGLSALIGCVFFFTASTLAAEGSYLGFGAGLHFNLGDLGLTISKDGLESNVGAPNLNGAQVGTGCAGDLNCIREVPGLPQYMIVPENNLLVYERLHVGIGTKESGAMVGGVLNVFWEKEGENTFWRVGMDYTKKIKGGRTESWVGPVKWYDIQWEYRTVFIPFYYGFKAKVGETAAAYVGMGINYYEGGWSVGGLNWGDLPTQFIGARLGNIGATTVVDSNGLLKGGPIINEGIKFRVKGFGFNAVVGVESKTQSGNKVFMELDYKVAAGFGLDRTRSIGGAEHLAPWVSYPQDLSGVIFRFGYKLAM